MDASWASVIVAALVGLGSLVGFYVNRRDIKRVRDEADEVRWALSPVEAKNTLLLTNLGRDTAYDVKMVCEGSAREIPDAGDVKGRTGVQVFAIGAWGMGDRVLTVTWSTKPGSQKRRSWTHPFVPTAVDE